MKALPDLSALPKLERLEIRKPLASLDGIEACPALRVVELGEKKLVDRDFIVE